MRPIYPKNKRKATNPFNRGNESNKPPSGSPPPAKRIKFTRRDLKSCWFSVYEAFQNIMEANMNNYGVYRYYIPHYPGETLTEFRITYLAEVVRMQLEARRTPLTNDCNVIPFYCFENNDWRRARFREAVYDHIQNYLIPTYAQPEP